MFSDRAKALSEGKLVHVSPRTLKVQDLKNGLNKVKTTKMEAFWFSYSAEWLKEYSRQDGFVYEVVIPVTSFVTLDQEGGTDKILSVPPADLPEFTRLFTKRDKLLTNKLEACYGGLAFPDFNKKHSKAFWYNTLDVSSGSIWNTKEIVKDLKCLGRVDLQTVWYDECDYDFLTDIIPL